jgi:CubicO group peptidase (beta-lactamase class C family)
MKRLLASSLPLLAACAAGSPPPSSTPPAAAPAALAQRFAERGPEVVFTDPDRRRKLESAFPEIDRLAEAALRADELPSLVLGVVVDGDLAYAKGFGYADVAKRTKADADTAYRIGSVTKSITALALLGLRDQGALSLDDPLTRFVPEAAGLVYPTRDAPLITLRMLLTHDAGLPHDAPPDRTRAGGVPGPEDVLPFLAGLPLEITPGTRGSYSNLGFELAGIAAARAARTSLGELVRRRIFAPLGMTSTTFDAGTLPAGRVAVPYRRGPSGPEVTHDWGLGENGSGGLWSTVRDLGRLVAFELSAYAPETGPDTGPARRSSVRESHYNARSSGIRVEARPWAQKGESPVGAVAWSAGYGWSLFRTCDFERLVGKNGAVGGFSSDVFMLPGEGVGVVLLRNVSGDVSDTGELARGVLLALKKTGGLAARVQRWRPAPAFDAVMPKILALYDRWDDGAYQALLSPRRFITLSAENERETFATLKRMHGACKGYMLKEALGPSDARFALQCERGALEIVVRLDPIDGLVHQHVEGHSRDVPAPPELGRVADQLAGLVGAWDDAVYAKNLAAKGRQTRDEAATVFARQRAGHGTCKVRSYDHWTNAGGRSTGVLGWGEGDAFTLACERGGDLKLSLRLDPEGSVLRYELDPVSSGTCPTL